MKAILSPDRGLALLRMGVGLYFIANGYDKVHAGWLSNGRQLQRMLQPALRRSPFWYAHFLQTTVLPHVTLFSRLVTTGELLVGISLVLGLLTPVGAIGAIFLTTNYMLQSPVANLITARDRLFMLCGLVFLLSAAGSVWSLDALLSGMLRRRAFVRDASGGTAPTGEPSGNLPERG
jgi:thiosulfate dehydrogenase (quinone) large subunit